MSCKALYFSEFLTEKKVYLCLLCWGTATTFFTIPVEREAATARGSANKTALASENLNLKLLPHFLHWSYSGESQVSSTNKEFGSLQSPPALWFSFLVPRTRRALQDLSLGGFFSLHCSCGGLYAQSRFTHLHDCHCPLSLILGSHNVFTVLLIFPGSGSGGVLKCVSRPSSVVFFCSQQSVSKPFFSPPSCVSVTSLLSVVPLRPLY